MRTLQTVAIALAIALTTIFTGCTDDTHGQTAYQQCVDNGGRKFYVAPLNGLQGGTGCEINGTYNWLY
jgi:hypothetical protein